MKATPLAQSPSPTCSTFLVRGPDGEEFEFIPQYGYQENDLDYLAQAVAKDDYEQSGPDLCDPTMWPREYEILWGGEWRKVSVGMEYDPVFSSNDRTLATQPAPQKPDSK